MDGDPNRRVFSAAVSLTAGQAVARLLSFAFYLAAARELTPADFGVVRYTITIGTFMLLGIQVLAVAAMREIGAARGDWERTSGAVGATAVCGLGLWVVGCALGGVLASAGGFGAVTPFGVAAAVTGLTAFELYYAMARGLGEVGRGIAAYVGGSALQLGAVIGVTVLVRPSPNLALAIFGGTALIPIGILEMRRGIIPRFSIRPTRRAAGALWTIMRTLLFAQVMYLVWLGAGQVWVQRTRPAADVGLYAAAFTLSQLFLILPAGINGVVMPRVAELRDQGRDREAVTLTARAVAITAVLSGIICVGIIIGEHVILDVAYGSSYGDAGRILSALAVGMAAYATFIVLTTSAVGWGWPGLYAQGICAAAIAEVALLVGLRGSTAAAAGWAAAASILLGLAVVGGRLLMVHHSSGRSRLKERRA